MVFRKQKVQRVFSIFTLVIFINLLNACTYYKVKSYDLESINAVEQVNQSSSLNYFYVHTDTEIWELNQVRTENNTITGIKSDWNKSSRQYHYHNKVIKGYDMRVPSREKQYIHQVHIYTSSASIEDNEMRVAGENITYLEIYDLNKGVIIVSAFATAGLVVAGGIGLAIIIVKAMIAGVSAGINSVCGCPHVYTYNGETYNYNNTMYTGAISPQIERHDYQIMPDYFSNSDSYELLIKNELEEKQYTNLMELMVINHPRDIDVFTDVDGNIHSISNPILPIKAVDDTGVNLLDKVSYNDDLPFQFNNETMVDYSHLYATFDKPENTSNPELVIKSKNNMWGGFVYKEFSKLFGRKHANWVKNNQDKSKEEMELNIKEQGIPLVVSIKKGEEWVDLESIDLIGEIAYNTLVIPIDELLLQEDQIEIRIRSGFLFWELDYLAIDFGDNIDLDVQRLNPSLISGNGTTAQLMNDDDLYMEHLATGDSAFIKFEGINNQEELERTIILHSKGYYLSNTEYTGKPMRKELLKFRKAGELSRYSKQLYSIFSDGIAVSH